MPFLTNFLRAVGCFNLELAAFFAVTCENALIWWALYQLR